MSIHVSVPGVIGELPKAEPIESFLRRVAVYFKTEQLRYSVTEKTAIKRVAICGGAGAFLWKQAKRAGADILITGEAKYNDYFDCEGAPILCTVGALRERKHCGTALRTDHLR